MKICALFNFSLKETDVAVSMKTYVMKAPKGSKPSFEDVNTILDKLYGKTTIQSDESATKPQGITPIVIQTHEDDPEKKKIYIPDGTTYEQLVDLIRQKNLQPILCIRLFVNGDFLTENLDLAELYKKNKRSDGYLYINYCDYFDISEGVMEKMSDSLQLSITVINETDREEIKKNANIYKFQIIYDMQSSIIQTRILTNSSINSQHLPIKKRERDDKRTPQNRVKNTK